MQSPGVGAVSEERVVAEWTEMPFTSYDRRGDVVEHRVVLEYYGETGADVRHEYRSSDADRYPDEWTEYTAYELRDHGIRQVQRNTGVPRS